MVPRVGQRMVLDQMSIKEMSHLLFFRINKPPVHTLRLCETL